MYIKTNTLQPLRLVLVCESGDVTSVRRGEAAEEERCGFN